MQSYSKRVSMVVVKRLPRYYQQLIDLELNDVEKISSQDLAKMMGLTASQIRQDLNSFGAYGQQGYGYRVVDLKNAIKDILGLNVPYNCIIIGSGNLGHAIANYEGFKQKGIRIIGMFDNNANIVGEQVGDINVRHMDGLEPFCEKNHVDICVLAVPRDVGQKTAEDVINLGIKAFLNFVPLTLSVPEDVVVEDVNITDSLYTLTYLLNEARNV